MAGSVREMLLRRPTKLLWSESEDLWRFREAAAVLASFDADAINAMGSVSSSTARTELLADCEVTYDADANVAWSLRTPIRQSALRRLFATNSVHLALAANPSRPQTRLQQLLEQSLLGADLRRWDAASAEDGRALLTVAEWLGGMPEHEIKLPAVEEVQQRLAWEQMLQPFRQLAGTTFAGRTGELNELTDYVGFFDARSLHERAARVVEHVLSIRKRPPLFINGPGGCGKSTLIARFILDHASIRESERFPFAYLDFDRPGLLAEEPITLLTEIMRQLSIEFPDSAAPYAEICDLWSKRIAEQIATTSPTASRFRLDERGAYLDEFADFSGRLKTQSQPLLLVLDTFEEVQFRSAAFADEIFDFLEELQKRIPRLRTVLSGRADIESKKYKVRKVTIGNFDKEAAVAILIGQGIRDGEVAAKIFEQVGGSPLVLRLAADVARIENVDQSGIDGLPSGWLSVFRSKSIEVVLYKRILSHIFDPRVQQLAYPGLVLRVITSEVLTQILAKPCGVAIASRNDADQLLKTMRAQLTTILIPSASDDRALVHRPDMRAILLQDLSAKSDGDKDVASKLNDIHEAAIEFYAKRDGVTNRAEELYHRLALGVDRDVLASRWLAGLNPYLGSSIRELPEASQIYVAARLEIELPEDLWNEASDDDWVFYAIRVAKQKSELGKPLEALDLLAKRPALYDHELMRPVVDRVALEIYHDYARQYERIRETQKPGDPRTRNMDALVHTLSSIQQRLPIDRGYADRLFAEDKAGARLVGLAIAIAAPRPAYMDMAIECIRNARSPFEQFHALRLARRTLVFASDEQRRDLASALQHQRGVQIPRTDASRYDLRDELFRMLEKSSKK